MKSTGLSGWHPGLIYLVLTGILLSLPLVKYLHAESCAVIATVAFFVAGLDGLRQFRARRLISVYGLHLAWLSIPFVGYQAARLLRPGCEFLPGLKFYLLFPVITVLFAVSLSYLVHVSPIRLKRAAFLSAGLAILALPPVYDLGFHPQFYVYNHIFGGFLGPIYDLELTDRSGLYWFRLLTLLWSALLLLVSLGLKHPDRRNLWAVARFPVIVCIGVFYLFSGRLGINTPAHVIQRDLGGRMSTEHFEIFYDPTAVSEEEISWLALDHEFRYYRLSSELGLRPRRKVYSYLYPSAARRAELTGAGYTNIAPVWLRAPQLHVLVESYERSFPHELAHVFSREMGIPVVRASLRVGLVEGFAVAMEPPLGLPSATDILAGAWEADTTAITERRSLARDLSDALSPAGFWGGRGAVSYTTMGSFVRFLIDQYGIDKFRRVYAMRSFYDVYGKPLDILAREWERKVVRRIVDPATAELASERFSVLSLFERRCPHDVPEAVLLYRDATAALDAGDSTRAMAALEELLRVKPDMTPAIELWADILLARDQPSTVRELLERKRGNREPMEGSEYRRLGDAHSLLGESSAALDAYDEALERFSPYERALRATTIVRTYLADRADIVEILTAGTEPKKKADLLSVTPDTSGATLVLAGLYSFASQDYENAYQRFVAADSLPAALSLGSRLPAWIAAAAYRSGFWETAERNIARASEIAAREKDRYELLRLNEFEERIRWVKERVS